MLVNETQQVMKFNAALIATMVDTGEKFCHAIL